MEDSKMDFKFNASVARLLFFMIILVIVAFLCFYECKQMEKEETEKIKDIEEDDEEKPKTSRQNYNVNVEIRNEPKYEFSKEDEELLVKIAMAEAGGESLEGKALVMCVVLNRVADDRFPSTIHDVIYQPYQFSPVSSGIFEGMEPSDECYEALEMVKNGWDESEGALYFESCTGNPWEGTEIMYLFSEGGHEFYK